MYLLEWIQGENRHIVGVFDTLKSGREFMKKVPGYRLKQIKDDDFLFEEEIIEYVKLPDIMMIEYNQYKVPVSRFSFEEDISVIWVEIDSLDKKSFYDKDKEDNKKIISGVTKIDAYSINNEDVYDYVKKREEQFKKAKNFLIKKGFEVDRQCFASEDGEAIFIRKKEMQWHFLLHMDPSFLEIDIEKEILNLLYE